MDAGGRDRPAPARPDRPRRVAAQTGGVRRPSRPPHGAPSRIRGSGHRRPQPRRPAARRRPRPDAGVQRVPHRMVAAGEHRRDGRRLAGHARRVAQVQRRR
ncbi:MAG: hypothetical protein E6G06_13290 [Actinobacteria bacterium]|nr:MAG: hypothetical protein E6G06_13290 [Actinomycetota bacterium]